MNRRKSWYRFVPSSGVAVEGNATVLKGNRIPKKSN